MAYKQYITSETDVPGPAQTGTGLWTDIGGTDALKQMAKVLPNALGVDVNTRDKLTVPSPWSSVISFDLLLDSELDYGLIKGNTLTEWRTLITLIALRKKRNIPIKLETIDLSVQNHNFCKNILAQYPQNGIFKDEKNKKSWSKVTFIKLNDQIIGMLTPSNIVCSPYTYGDKQSDAVEWLQTNGLMSNSIMQDPMNYIFTSDGLIQRESIEYMLSWLDKIKEFLTKDGGMYFQNQELLVGRISKFTADIMGEAAKNGITIATIRTPLAHSIEPEHFENMREMIESIQGEHTWFGLLTAMAYEHLAEYRIKYVTDAEQTKELCSGKFHESIINDRTARAIVLDKDGTGAYKECIGVIRNGCLLSAPTSLGQYAIEALSKCGIMGEGGEYKNPMDFVMESPIRYVYILEWLKFIYAQLSVTTNVNSDVLNNINQFAVNLQNKLINRNDAVFVAEVNKYLGNKFITFSINGASTVIAADMFAQLTATCDFFQSGITAATTIVGSVGGDLVLFSDDTVGSEVMNFYKESMEVNANIKTIINDGSEKATVFNDSMVFESKLYYIKTIADKRINSDDAHNKWWINKTIDGQEYQYTVLWPIKKQVFEAIAANEIYNKISLEYDPKEDKCIIKLTLSVGDGVKGKEIWAVFDGPDKVGATTSAVIDSVLLPGISIWPYALLGKDNKDIGSYFVYQSKLMNVDSMDNVYTVECMPEAGGPMDDKYEHILERTSDTHNFERRITFRRTLPRYLAVKNKVDNSYYGAILLPLASALMTGGAKATVGLDFGTSSTTVYVSIGGGASKKAEFGNEIPYTPINHMYSDENNFFVPIKYSDNNFNPSIIRTSSYDAGPAINGISLPYMQGNIIYKYEYKQCTNATEDTSEIRTDLKWNPTDVQDTSMYLRQIMLQVLVSLLGQGVHEVEWHASYPSAFSRKQINDYKTTVASIANNVHAIINNSISNVGVKFMTESVAAGNFMVNAAAAAAHDGTMIVDIGGGSTDISYWRQGMATPLMQSSVEIASRKFFLAPLKELVKEEKTLRDMISSFGVPFNNIEKYIASDNDKDLSTLVEQVLLLRGNEFYNAVNGLTNKTNVDKFIQKIVVGFYSLMFYTVKLYVKRINSENIANNLMVCLCGNGAKMYDWIPDHYKESIHQLLAKMISSVGNRSNQINIRFDKVNAKTEAAQGLLRQTGGVDLGMQDSNVLSCVKVKFTYQDANGEIQVEHIDNDVDMWQNKAIQMCYGDSATGKGISFSIEEDSENKVDLEIFNEFTQQVNDGIFAGAFRVPVSETNMKARVSTEMGFSIQNNRLTSPFFPQVMSLIDAIK